MAGLLNAVGAAFLFLSMPPIMSFYFPKAEQASTTVRVYAGASQPGAKDISPGGNVPSIAVFDGNGGRLGFMNGKRHGKIEDGSYKDVTVNHIDKHKNGPAEYVSISSSGTDALCIAALTFTMADTSTYTFFGDVGKACGSDWYFSNLNFKTTTNSNYKPNCTWISSPESNGKNKFSEGMSFHVPDFDDLSSANSNRGADYAANLDTMCKSAPRWRTWPKISELNCIPIFNPPLPYQPNGEDPPNTALIVGVPGKTMCDPPVGTTPTGEQIRKLQAWTNFARASNGPTYGTKKRSLHDDDPDDDPPTDLIRSRQTIQQRRANNNACMDSEVIVSQADDHSARELCQSHTSAGPDFVHVKEGWYCDMCAHELWPVCSDKVLSGCFDMATHKMRPGAGLHGRELGSGRVVPDKSFDKVTKW